MGVFCRFLTTLRSVRSFLFTLQKTTCTIGKSYKSRESTRNLTHRIIFAKSGTSIVKLIGLMYPLKIEHLHFNQLFIPFLNTETLRGFFPAAIVSVTPSNKPQIGPHYQFMISIADCAS